MKSIIASILMIWSFTGYCQQYWLSVSSPVNKTLTRSFFIDTVNGWAAGDSGTIIHTSNSGVNWSKQSSGIGFINIDDIFFINQRLGWALANDFFYYGTIMLKTTDGGLNWTNSRFPDTSLVFNTIYFLDSLNGYMSGYSGLIYKTTNSGASWTNCFIDTAYCQYLYLFPKNKFYFINSTTGFACGGQIDIQGMVWKTTNSGANWYTYCVASEPLYDIKATSPNKIIANGGDYEYGLNTVVSTDGGVTWQYELNNILGRGYSLAFRTPKEVWVPLNFSESFALNTDSANYGSIWREIDAPDNKIINSTIFMSPTFGWSFGSEGSIFKYNTAVIGIDEQNYVPVEFKLNRNYPNPFNPSTNISYTLFRGGSVKADIYNINGELVSNIFNNYQPAGYHSLTWNAAEFSTGIYFFKLTSGNRHETIKMLLVK